ncbi:hypothetical protein MTO96_009964 [Rhipicephalus appendiculatus]
MAKVWRSRVLSAGLVSASERAAPFSALALIGRSYFSPNSRRETRCMAYALACRERPVQGAVLARLPSERAGVSRGGPDTGLQRWEAAPQEPRARKRKRAALLMVRPRAREERPWDAAGPVRRFLSPFRAPFDKRVDCRR